VSASFSSCTAATTSSNAQACCDPRAKCQWSASVTSTGSHSHFFVFSCRPHNRIRTCCFSRHYLFRRVSNRGGQGSGVGSGWILRLFSDPDTSQRICEKPDPDPESLFIFGSSWSPGGLHKCHCLGVAEFRCGHFLSRTWVNFGCVDGSRNLNRSRILTFENVSNPD